MAAVKRVLAPVDFSACSRAALEHAVHFARQMGATLDVLHVSEPVGYADSHLLAIAPEAAGGALEPRREDVRREIEAFVGALRGGVEHVLVESGIPGDVIAAVASDGRYDVIVMGTHGRSGLARLVMGSVAEAVMRKARVPVLTLRMPPKESARERIPL